jgi:hypothetical protein
MITILRATSTSQPIKAAATSGKAYLPLFAQSQAGNSGTLSIRGIVARGKTKPGASTIREGIGVAAGNAPRTMLWEGEGQAVLAARSPSPDRLNRFHDIN